MFLFLCSAAYSTAANAGAKPATPAVPPPAAANSQPAPKDNKLEITVDGKTIRVDPGTTIIQVYGL